MTGETSSPTRGIGYRVQASHNVVGRLTDFLVDDESWAIQSCVVDIGARLTGKRVLVLPAQIDHISWDTSTMHLNVPESIVVQAPAFNEISLDEPARERMTIFI